MPRKIIFFLLAILIGTVIPISKSHSDAKLLSEKRKIVVNLSIFELRVYEGKEIIFRSVAIGGKSWCHDTKRSCKTPPGNYRIGKKNGLNYRSGSYPIRCPNKKICGALMPYYLQFSGETFGIHGGFVPREPLMHISHSCIRIPLENARVLADMVFPGTPVVVLQH